MNSAEYRRQMGMDMPRPSRNMGEERFSVTTTSHVKPELKLLNFRVFMGIVMVDDGSGWRPATAEEIEQLTGGLSC